MIIDPHDRIAANPKPSRRRALPLAFVALVVAGLAILVVPAWRESARQTAFGAAAFLGLQPAPERFAALYNRLGVSSLPADVYASSEVSAGLDRLEREPCDRTAIFALGQALAAQHEERTAAEAYFGFAMTCPNSQNEEMRSADLFLKLGDLKKTIAIGDDLIAKDPAVSNSHYLRGKALAAAGRNSDAVADYKATIELTKNPREIGEWVFTELANIYMALGQACEAAASISAWVAIDPATHNTLRAHKLREEYLARGCGRPAGAATIKDL